MPDLIVSLQEVYKAYKKLVGENPQFVSDLETTAKWVSYFVAGRITSSNILSELIYSLSNLLVLLNDRIIEKAKSSVVAQAVSASDGAAYRIKLMLTSIEYCEVFIEISAKRLFGERGRWFFIIAVQVFKCIGRFLLTRQYSEEIIKVPAIPVLNRNKIAEEQKQAARTGDGPNDLLLNETNFSFKLKRSGRIIRKVEGAPPIHLRSFRALDEELRGQKLAQPPEIQTAETIYIAKPLVHLGAVGLFGYKSWKSYSVAFLMDLISIRMYYNHRHSLTKQQRVELSRRCVNLLLYLVRSPFYEKRTEKRIKGILSSLGNSIPFAKALFNPLSEYIPQWQSTYFYMWST